MDGIEVVRYYFEQHFHCVFWPAIGDLKGPRESNWPHKTYSLDDYHEGCRVGLLTGIETVPGRYLHDVDVDWSLGHEIATYLLPSTGLVFGRASKRVSHCLYTVSEPLVSQRYEDIDKTCLVELRGTKANGDIGLQTMVPPSPWSKGQQREPLTFVRFSVPGHVEQAATLVHGVRLTAIAMILAKHLGVNGFGHDVRLAWAGFLLRAGVSVDDLVRMGEAMSSYCNNREVSDVRRAVESTVTALASSSSKKVKGGPALAKILGDKGKAIIERVHEWLGHESDFVRDQQGRILAKHQGNIARAIEKLGHELSYNEFSDKLLMDRRPLEDPQWIPLCLEIEREFRFSPPVEYFKMVIKDLAWRNSFHPVKEYLNHLEWDQVPRLDTWLVTAASAADTSYVRAISAILLIAAVRRVRHPGVKYDEMIVWESSQGTNKSSAAQALCPNPEWFSDDLRLNLHAQQLIEATLGKWIIEASDLAGKRKTEIEQLKAMLSRQVDGPARMAYAHFAVERPRHFILIGTTNSKAYLTDQTGARRFWPVAVKQFDVPWVIAHRDQLWAEACAREARGDSIRLDESLWPEATVQQERRREIDPWELAIRQWLVQDIEPSPADNRRRITVEALWRKLNIPVEKRDRMGALRIAEIMYRLGFKRTTVREENVVQSGYVTDMDHVVPLEFTDDNEEREREPGEDDDLIESPRGKKNETPF